MNIKIYKALLVALIASHLAEGGEYPVIANNFDVEAEAINDDGTAVYPVEGGTYLLYRNQVKSISILDGKFEFDPAIPEANLPQDPDRIPYTEYNGSPRNFVVGNFDESRQVFVCRDTKLVSPTLGVSSRNQAVVPGTSADNAYGLKNVFDVRDLPAEIRDKSQETKERWLKDSRFHFKLDPPLPVDLVTTPEADTPPLEPGEKLVQGLFELGGAVVCGRKENNVLTLYRFSCSQRTHPNAIQVFNPDEKLTWDTEKSDTKALAALLHLKPDLLEHNTGTTENRLYVRMKTSAIKQDRPGVTKALRDWYLLGPFYDPVTQTYRDTLTRQDFVADIERGFDPGAPDFDPAVFVKKLVPYTLPADYWDQ